MKAMLKASTLATGLGAAAAIMFAPVVSASADEAAFLAEMRANGIDRPVNGDSTGATLLQFGYQVCQNNKAGMSADQSAREIDSKSNLSLVGGQTLVAAANRHLC